MNEIKIEYNLKTLCIKLFVILITISSNLFMLFISNEKNVDDIVTFLVIITLLIFDFIIIKYLSIFGNINNKNNFIDKNKVFELIINTKFIVFIENKYNIESNELSNITIKDYNKYIKAYNLNEIKDINNYLKKYGVN